MVRYQQEEIVINGQDRMLNMWGVTRGLYVR